MRTKSSSKWNPRWIDRYPLAGGVAGSSAALSTRENLGQMSKCVVAARHHCKAVGIPPGWNKNNNQIIMKYALLVHQPQEYFDRRKEAASIAAGMAYGEALRGAGVLVTGAGLKSPQTATTVSVRDGKRHVHDGPYAETKEFLAGFAIIDVPDLDAALEWAARHPAASDTSVEVRPLLAHS
jgi:hypothetical protein